ncbi:MAG: hypothetical protein ABI592_05300 [Acidobacteriota bacterium]
MTTGDPVRATITGPFGSPVAVYENGALRGEKFAPVVIEPEPLLWLLAGIWKDPDPQVRGILGGDALLVWSGPARAEGVLNLAQARFASLRVERDGRTYEASYGETADPWPRKVSIEERSSASRLQLTLQARESLR